MLLFDKISQWPQTMIVAHRGAGHARSSSSIHENTIDAFNKAIDIGADAIELDLRRTRNGIIIVHHDNTIKGMKWPIGESPAGVVKEAALELEYKIPDFEETLEFCSGKISLDIELKETGYEKEVVDLTFKFYEPGNVCFTSFHDISIRRIKEYNSQAITGLLLGDEPPAGAAKRISELFPKNIIEYSKPDFVAPNWRFLKWGGRIGATCRGLPMIAWTVNDLSYARKLIDRKIAAIISDVPEKILPLLNRDADFGS